MDEEAIELWKQAAELGSSHAHHFLGNMNDEGGDFKKTKFHYGLPPWLDTKPQEVALDTSWRSKNQVILNKVLST